MARHHLINGIKVPFTAEEEAARDAEEAQAVIDQEAREAAEVARKANVASAKTKLQNFFNIFLCTKIVSVAPQIAVFLNFAFITTLLASFRSASKST